MNIRVKLHSIQFDSNIENDRSIPDIGQSDKRKKTNKKNVGVIERKKKREKEIERKNQKLTSQ